MCRKRILTQRFVVTSEREENTCQVLWICWKNQSHLVVLIGNIARGVWEILFSIIRLFLEEKMWYLIKLCPYFYKKKVNVSPACWHPAPLFFPNSLRVAVGICHPNIVELETLVRTRLASKKMWLIFLYYFANMASISWEGKISDRSNYFFVKRKLFDMSSSANTEIDHVQSKKSWLKSNNFTRKKQSTNLKRSWRRNRLSKYGYDVIFV